MFFYVDESGHTGSELFDAAQPVLYYGVISSDVNLDVLAEERLAPLRKRLSVDRLHAAQLGVGRLATISEELVAIQKKFSLRFDLYRVNKPDHAVICFFDQVFDQAMNPAVTWTSYWTPLRYILLLKLASLFEEDDARLAWSARTDTNRARANGRLIEVCQRIAGRVDQLPDARSRQLIGDGLTWAAQNPDAIGYNVDHADDIKQISPNIIGFQFVMHGIAKRIMQRGKRASRIVVDRQSEFNKAQKTLSEFFAAASGIEGATGPGMPKISFAGMPKTPIEFAAGTDSAGLELVDVYLWIFKRLIDGKDMAPGLMPLVYAQRHRGNTDEVSLRAIETRWEQHFTQMPELENIPQEKIEAAQKIIAIEESRRQAAIKGMIASR
ncbi:DUF3800 domain-containing protein [Devosia sp.]|uniref:DUF3800 domain-containing protein n=1 Tax=Devosia sp. TaxID=1871048 RepID=UPI002735CE16|nr:DUF3800 domain-containing protein [Devosia sp.]MDP2780034.1 DUF3800 domain-containing protein [Devosia sp.]